MKLHRTQFLAQCELANKRHPELWRIEKTVNGWWIVSKQALDFIAAARERAERMTE